MTRTLVMAASLATTLGACAITDGEVQTYPPELVGASQVEAVLAPGATKVSLFGVEAVDSVDDAFTDQVQVREAWSDGGRLLAAVGVTQVRYTDSPKGGAYRVSPEGVVTRLDLDGLPRVATSAVPGVDTGWLLYCDGAATLVGLTPSGDLERHDGDPALCGALVGGSRREDWVVRVAEGAGTVQLHPWNIRAATAGPTLAVALPNSDARVVFAEELDAGRYRVIAATTAGLYSVSEDGSFTATTWGGAVATAWVDRATDAVWVASGAEVGRWSGVDGEDVERFPAPSALDGLSGWRAWRFQGTPGAWFAERSVANTGVATLNAALRVPLEVRARTPADSTATPEVVASTPCLVRSECRRFGESYLVGVHDHPTGPLGVYLFWAWTDPIAFFVAPLDRRDD